MRWLKLSLLLLSLALPLSETTLSKSDKKKKPTAKEAAKPTPASPRSGRRAKVDGGPLAAKEVLANHERLEWGLPRAFPNPVLAYVTPWNNRGYDIAKWASHKLTHLTPVWFQVLPDTKSDDSRPTCTIGGAHDMDQGWLEETRKNNSDLNVVPRFIFEKWSGMQLRSLLTYEDQQNACADVIVKFIQRNRFAGAALELWVAIMSMSQGLAAADLIRFLRNVGEIFQSEGLVTVLPVPPSLDARLQPSRMFSQEHFAELAPYIDYFQVMTYDFPSGRMGPVAPLEWVQRCVEDLLLPNPKRASQLLLGLNMYGYDYSPDGKVEPKLGRDLVELLKAEKKGMEWEATSAEHFLRHSNGHTLFYPSLASVAARLELAKELGVGVALWEAGQGLDYFYNLL